MSFIHDTLKIMYVREGYLPNYPYHLMSDNEMADAFLNLTYPVTDEVWDNFINSEDSCYFKDQYPCPGDDVIEEYKSLVSSLAYHINMFKNSTEDNKKLPDWVYSYMLGITISGESDEIEQEYLFSLLGQTNIDVTFDANIATKCYHVSEAWLRKSSNLNADRVPTIFGEPHVIKALRLTQMDTLRG